MIIFDVIIVSDTIVRSDNLVKGQKQNNFGLGSEIIEMAEGAKPRFRTLPVSAYNLLIVNKLQKRAASGKPPIIVSMTHGSLLFHVLSALRVNTDWLILHSQSSNVRNGQSKRLTGKGLCRVRSETSLPDN